MQWLYYETKIDSKTLVFYLGCRLTLEKKRKEKKKGL